MASAFATVIVMSFVGDVSVHRAAAADVEITANTPSVNLDTFVGSTAHVANGVTVGPGLPAISATSQAWFLTNDGTVTGGSTIKFLPGGTITNNAGKTISGTATAITFGDLVSGNPVGGPGTVNNYGTITGGVEGVTMWFGGTVNNYFGGTIQTATGLNAVSIGQGASRTLFNAGTIAATRTAGFSTGVLIQGGPAAFTNTGTGVIFGDFNGVYGSASVAFTSFVNAGVIRSSRGSAAEVWGGGTIVNTGTIENLGNGSNSDSNGILIRNNAAADVTNSGTITGRVNAINFALSGGAAPAATHTLRLQTGSILNGNVVGGSGTDNLILQGTGTESIAKFLNFETLTMNGGDWALTGNGTFSASTTVQSGALRVNGQLTSPVVSVLAGGTLTGAGTVVGNVTNESGGNVQVNSGTLTFDGNYVHQAGALFTVGVTPSTNGALLVSGAGHKATLNGGTVRVLAGAGNYALNTQYTILTAAGGRTGAFDNAISNFTFLDPSLSYDANNVYLTLVRNSVAFAGIGSTPNQISAGGGLENLGLTNPIVEAVLLLTPDQARAAFDSVSGEVHPSLHSQMLGDAVLVRDAIMGRQRQLGEQEREEATTPAAFADEDVAALSYAKKERKTKSGPARPVKVPPRVSAPVWGAWAQAYGNWNRLDGDGNAATLRATHGGAIGGVDVTFANNWRIGLAAGGGRTDAKVDARQSSGTIDSIHFAAYGGGRLGDILLRAGGAYSHHDISTTRTVAMAGFADNLAASYNGNTVQAFGEAAYRLPAGRLVAEAFAGLAHVRVSTDSFVERGGAAALSVSGADTSGTFSTLGLRGQAPFALGSWSMTARGSLGWQHAFDDSAPVSWMSFAASPSPFAIAGVPIATDSLLVEAGFDALLDRNMTLALLYTGRIASDADSHALKASFAVKF